MKQFGKIFRNVVPNQSRSVQAGSGGFINEQLGEWPNWRKEKTEDQANRGDYKNGVSFEMATSIPKIVTISRTFSKTYSIYMDKKAQLVYFYPSNEGSIYYRELKQMPS